MRPEKSELFNTWGEKVLKNRNIEKTVEAICQKGCQAVRDDLVKLKAGQIPAETESLNHKERKAVYKELKSIMAVYGDACRVDGDVASLSPRQTKLINDNLIPAFPES